MLQIGCHLSSSKGFLHMGKEALSIHATTFQFFTRNPRGSKVKALDIDDINALLKLMDEHEIKHVVAHAPYTLNPCSATERTREFALETMQDDLMRLDYLPNQFYNFHPGSHVGQGAEVGIQKIAEILNEVLTEEQTTIVLLETMAGKGSEVGRSFEELHAILELVKKDHKMGICLDTCHVWDGGYDIVNDLDGVLTEFDKVIGLSRLRAVHLNDSMNGLGSHKDRHARIGEGEIGLEALVRVIRHPVLKNIPFILETPNDDAGWTREITLLREAFEK